MRISIDNRIRLHLSDLPPEAISEIKSAFRYNNPAFFKAKNLGFYTGNIQRVIATFEVGRDVDSISVPRGGLKKLLDILDDFSIKVDLKDNRISGKAVDYQLSEDIKLRDYQALAIESILKHESCLIQGAPAAGKTEILLGAIAKAGLKTGVLVHDRNLMNQWVNRIEKRLGIPKKQIGVVGQGKFKIGDQITVMMQQTARNRVDRLWDQFGFLAADEAHHYSANTFLQTVDAFPAKYRIGVTATVKRQDLKHFLAFDLFGPVAFSVNRDDLVDLGYTTEIELHIVPTDFQFDYRNELALRMYLDDKIQDFEDYSAAERRTLMERLGLKPAEYPQYLDATCQNRDRNNLIYKYLKREYDSGSTCIIFTKRRSHCQLWSEQLAKVGVECVVLWGTSGSKREIKKLNNDLNRLKKREVRVAIGTVLDEGIDMPAVDAGFITYRNAGNPGQLEQQAGRLARLFTGKDVGRLYYFHDRLIKGFMNDSKILKKKFNRVVEYSQRRITKRVKSRG